MKKIIEKDVRCLAKIKSQIKKITISNRLLSLTLGFKKSYFEAVKRALRTGTDVSIYREDFVNIKSLAREFLNKIIGKTKAINKIQQRL